MLFTFPSRYLFAIGLSGVFSLTGWSRLIRAEFLVIRVTQDTTGTKMASNTGLSPSMEGLSKPLPLTITRPYRGPTTPTLPKQYWFGLVPGRSPLLGESLLFSFPAGTKMFQFPALASSYEDDWPSARRVVPFGYLRVKAYLQLTAAFRSLSRPSSPPRAKASTVCP